MKVYYIHRAGNQAEAHKKADRMLVAREEDGEFLTLDSTSSEYPDAAKFSRVSDAARAVRDIASSGRWEIIRNYGLSTEEVAHVVNLTLGWQN